MISIAGKPAESGSFGYQANSLETQMLDMLSKSSSVYRYDNAAELKFELALRKGIVNASKELNRSGMSFRIFRKSKCNPDFWLRTDEGGFKLQPGVKPHDAVNDIYANGSQYGTECATAMVIIYFKALADILPEQLFDQLFPDIYLMNWQHLDRDMGITTIDSPDDYLPGDARYFKNPDVDPVHPEWQGENTFAMGDGMYYGHGIGIGSADRIIDALNHMRREDATKPAYLMDMAERPNFKHLSGKLEEYKARQQPASP